MMRILYRRAKGVPVIEMQIVLDGDKIRRTGAYSEAAIQASLDNFMINHLHLRKEDHGFYRGTGSREDFSLFGLAFSVLRREAWFMDNVKTWLYYNSGSSRNLESYTQEDFKAYCLKNPAPVIRQGS